MCADVWWPPPLKGSICLSKTLFQSQQKKFWYRLSVPYNLGVKFWWKNEKKQFCFWPITQKLGFAQTKVIKYESLRAFWDLIWDATSQNLCSTLEVKSPSHFGEKAKKILFWTITKKLGFTQTKVLKYESFRTFWNLFWYAPNQNPWSGVEVTHFRGTVLPR